MFLIITSAILGHCCCYHINFCVSLICLEMNSSTSCVFQPNYLEFDQFTLMCLSRAEGNFSVQACNKTGNLVVQHAFWTGGQLVGFCRRLLSLVAIILAENILPEVTQRN